MDTAKIEEVLKAMEARFDRNFQQILYDLNGLEINIRELEEKLDLIESRLDDKLQSISNNIESVKDRQSRGPCRRCGKMSCDSGYDCSHFYT